MYFKTLCSHTFAVLVITGSCILPLHASEPKFDPKLKQCGWVIINDTKFMPLFRYSNNPNQESPAPICTAKELYENLATACKLQNDDPYLAILKRLVTGTQDGFNAKLTINDMVTIIIKSALLAQKDPSTADFYNHISQLIQQKYDLKLKTH